MTLPLARDLLEACGQPLEIPAELRDWHEMASRHPAVERALAPWWAATRAWLTS